MGLLIVSPYLLYVQVTEGLAEHVRVGLEFGKAEQHQVLWGMPSLTPEEGGLAIAIGGWRLSPEALLLWMYSAVTVGADGGAGELETRARAAARPPRSGSSLAAFRLVILRASASGAPARCGSGGGLGGRDRRGRGCCAGCRRGGARVRRGPSAPP